MVFFSDFFGNIFVYNTRNDEMPQVCMIACISVEYHRHASTQCYVLFSLYLVSDICKTETYCQSWYCNIEDTKLVPHSEKTNRTISVCFNNYSVSYIASRDNL